MPCLKKRMAFVACNNEMLSLTRQRTHPWLLLCLWSLGAGCESVWAFGRHEGPETSDFGELNE